MPQIKYSSLHWLAYWNDHRSIEFLLSTLPGTDRERIQKLLLPNSEDYTAIDFAGMHKSFECLLIMILYFRENFHILHLVFSFDKNGKPRKDDDKDK